MLLEEAGAIPATPGMVNSGQQMLLQKSGIMPQFAPGGKVVSGLAKFLEESKIPQRLYHGTTASEEKGAKALSQLKQSKEGALGSGVYMTPNPEFASQYANEAGGYVMPVHTNLRNPLEIHSTSGVGGNGDPMKLALMQLGVPEAKAEKIIEDAYEKRGYIGKEVMSRAQKQGYDGIAQYRDGDLAEVVSYNPMSIKSATGNTGDFDPYDPRLSKAEGGHISPQDMVAELIAANQTPQMFKDGGRSIAKKLIMPGVLAGLLTPDIVEASQQAKEGKYGEAAGTAGLIASGFLSGPLQAILMGMYPSELGKGTLDEYYAERVPGSVLPARLKPENMK